MSTVRMFLYNDTRLMMLRQRRRVFFRRAFGVVGVVVALSGAAFLAGCAKGWF